MTITHPEPTSAAAEVVPEEPTVEAADVEAQVGALAESLFGGAIGAFELLTVFVGAELGLYDLLAEQGPATPVQLADRAGIDARYAREWLEHQAIAGLVDVVAGSGTVGADGEIDPDTRAFELTPAQAEVLVNRDSLAYLTPLARFVAGAGATATAVVEAYRSGDGITFGGYGEQIRQAQSELNRPQFLTLLAADWLPSMPDVVARLEADPPALVADVGCGTGWSSIALAQAFPKIEVQGFDLDEASIADARANAAAAGVADRVTFAVRDAADAAPGAYDLVCIFESLHDTGRPVDVLAALGAMAGPDGTVFVVDEHVEDTFTAPGPPTERFLASASVLHCLLVGRSDPHNHATGTMLRTPLLRRLAEEAGCTRFEVLPVEHDLFRFYRLGR